MQKFQTFYFEKFEFDKEKLQASFFYSFDELEFFEEIIDFSSDFFEVRQDIDYEIINNILFHLHIALGISYYKLFPTEKLIIKSGNLDEEQITFWHKFYKNGLGEFLYTNKISPKGLFNFVNESNKKFIKKEFIIKDRALVPVGGGKDSIVSIELLKNIGLDFDLFTFGVHDNILYQNTQDISGKNRLWIKRIISDNLIKLVNKGYYNGHVPITGLIAFVMEAVGYMYNYKYLILSNERSANYGNINWEGLDVNHQYSKSLEFEKDFKNYVENYITSKVKYFSLLRGLYEFKIAELFSKLGKDYFSKFSSCNFNFKIFSKNKLNQKNGKYWCNNCPKCAFVYSILSGFLKEDELITIFGEDLYKKKSLENLFKELLGISGIKPFECVGEKEEVILGMHKALKNYDTSNIPFILKILKTEVLNKLDLSYLDNLEKKLLKNHNEDIIPKELKEKIKI